MTRITPHHLRSWSARRRRRHPLSVFRGRRVHRFFSEILPQIARVNPARPGGNAKQRDDDEYLSFPVITCSAVPIPSHPLSLSSFRFLRNSLWFQTDCRSFRGVVLLRISSIGLGSAVVLVILGGGGDTGGGRSNMPKVIASGWSMFRAFSHEGRMSQSVQDRLTQFHLNVIGATKMDGLKTLSSVKKSVFGR